jgi:dCMP deaminase
MKDKFLEYFMRVAEETAALSYAKRLQVGCVVVKDNRILSIGYNGTPAGWDNSCEDIFEDVDPRTNSTVISSKTKNIVIHAESNAITKLAASTESSKDAVAFVTHAPCIDCAKLLYQSGISEVIYKEEYRDKNGIEFLEKCGVKVWQKKTSGQLAESVSQSLE